MTKNLLTFFVSLILSLILFEFILRFFDLETTSSISTVNTIDYQRIPGMFSPGQTVVDTRNPQLAHNVTINKLGFRGEDFKLEKPADTTRIVMIGDSFTYGDFVDDKDTLPAQLQTVLQEQCHSNIQVVNAGLGGSTITDQMEMTKRILLLKPDLVVLTFYENDVKDLLKSSVWDQLAKNRERKSKFPLSIVYPIVKNLATWNFVLKLKSKLGSVSTTNQKKPSTDNKKDLQNDSLRIKYREHLVRYRDFLKQNNVQFLLAYYPSHITFTNRSDAEHRSFSDNISWIDTTAKQMNLPRANILQEFLASGDGTKQLYLLPHDGHASPKGNLLAAKTIKTSLFAYFSQKKYCSRNFNKQVMPAQNLR